jgi:tryptophanyl-tRNA synthetase
MLIEASDGGARRWGYPGGPSGLASAAMTRVLSGIQPTGETHLGNYLGAIRYWVHDQHEHDAFYCIVDLHALTVPQEPEELRTNTLAMAMILLAAGLDPEVCTLFVQSHVPEHPQLGWVMECTASLGELQRMTQFKDKSSKQGAGFISAGLLTYPALQAADILMYDANFVPVGEDQRQHIELTRDLAIRFNHRYGDTFVVPEASIPHTGARVMDLQEPSRKMSKSAESPQGTVLVLDPPTAIAKKFKRAVTDSETEVRFDPEAKPGVSNLLSILAACTGSKPEALAEGYSQYGPLKADTGEAVTEVLRPLQARYEELAGDPAETARLLAIGAGKARAVASKTLARAQANLGLLAPG